VYGISVAADLVGMDPQSLRLYERRGLLEPARTNGGTRRYSSDDLARLERIGQLLAAGLNLVGISPRSSRTSAGADRGTGQVPNPWSSDLRSGLFEVAAVVPAHGGTMTAMRLGTADHLGWAVAVTATADYRVVDRRRIELIEPGMPVAPVHHAGGPHQLHRSGEPLSDSELAALVADVRASVVRAASAALAELAAALPAPILSLSLRTWPADFPADIAVQRRVPYESRADAIMYRQVLTDVARNRGWAIHLYDPRTVEAEAARLLGARADEVLRGPRATLGPPWAKDHRVALAATIVAA